MDALFVCGMASLAVCWGLYYLQCRNSWRMQEAFQQYKDDKNFIRLPVLHYVAPLGDVVRCSKDGCYVQVYDAIPASTKVMVAYDGNDNAKILTQEQFSKLTWIYPRPN